MLDEDNILNETPKSPVINLPHETTGASQLEGSTEIAKTQMTPTNSVVRNLRSHPFITCSSNYDEGRKDN